MVVIYKSKWFWQETIVIPPFRNIGTRIGEATQWLTALASLSKKLWFTFQHPYGVSQIPLTTVPGNLTPYSPSMGIRYTYGGDAYI